jgi:hypothetical protein
MEWKSGTAVYQRELTTKHGTTFMIELRHNPSGMWQAYFKNLNVHIATAEYTSDVAALSEIKAKLEAHGW